MADKEYWIEIEGFPARVTTFNDFDITIEESDGVLSASLRSLVSAFSGFARDRGDKLDRIGHVDEHIEELIASSVTVYHDSYLPWEERPAVIALLISKSGGVCIHLSVESGYETSEEAFASAAESILAQHSASLLGSTFFRAQENPPRYSIEVAVEIDLSYDMRTLFLIRREMAYSSFFPRSALHHARTIRELVRSGHSDRLVGMPESNCFEAKSSAYEMKNKNDASWKVELAQDAARFANSEEGGVLIIGATTKRRGPDDVVTKISPIPADSARVQSYRKILDDRIHPPIAGILAEATPYHGGEILAIYVPPQREEYKPFLVQGGVLEGKYEGTMISIVRRRGEESVPITAREIHAMLVAGRALLRGGRQSGGPGAVP
jgi:hypothetical protein